MYTPPHFKAAHPNDVLSFMQAHPFGILASAANEKPLATHLPFIFAEAENPQGEKHLVLRTHLALANPQVHQLDQSTVLAIFSAPHAYISPSHYVRKENVPTWNYIAVHAYGTAKLLPTLEQRVKLLEETILAFEPGYMPQWRALRDTGSRYIAENLEELVAFEIEVHKVEAAFKLSQNKSIKEQERIAASLSAKGDAAAQGLAGYMPYPGLDNSNTQHKEGDK